MHAVCSTPGRGLPRCGFCAGRPMLPFVTSHAVASVTLGVRCDASAGLHLGPYEVEVTRPCAWPSRLAEWLHRAYPDTPRDTLEVVNMARHATTTQWAAGHVLSLANVTGQSLEDVDLFFIDFETNDQFHADQENIQGDLEDLLLQLLSLPQQPAIVCWFTGTVELNSMGTNTYKGGDKRKSEHGITDANDPEYFKARPWIEDEEMRLLRYYGIPALSWRDAFWPFVFTPNGQRNPLVECHNYFHPGACLHYVWAAVTAHLFRVETQFFCNEAAHRSLSAAPSAVNPETSPGESSSEWVPAFPVVRISDGKPTNLHAGSALPLSMLSVDLGEAAFVPAEVDPPGRWQYREDIPGKPGWIVEGPGGGEEISFDVMVQHKIVVGFMSSYENMGQVEVFVDTVKAGTGDSIPGAGGKSSLKQAEVTIERAIRPGAILDSLWHVQSSQYSQKTVYEISGAKLTLPVRVRIKRVEPAGDSMVDRGLNKFKLLSILSY
eukprot:jgi/Mesvir1/27455/Mv07238-RA.3